MNDEQEDKLKKKLIDYVKTFTRVSKNEKMKGDIEKMIYKMDKNQLFKLGNYIAETETLLKKVGGKRNLRRKTRNKRKKKKMRKNKTRKVQKGGNIFRRFLLALDDFSTNHPYILAIGSFIVARYFFPETTGLMPVQEHESVLEIFQEEHQMCLDRVSDRLTEAALVDNVPNFLNILNWDSLRHGFA